MQEARRREPVGAGTDDGKARARSGTAAHGDPAPVSGALASLPFEVRAALLLRFAMGLDAGDTAAAMGISSAACRGSLLHGLAMLSRAIEPQDGMPGADQSTPRAAPARPHLRALGAPTLARSDEP